MIVLSVSLRVPPGQAAHLKPQIAELVKGSRAEPGCRAYTYAEDIQEPNLLRVFEIYDDLAALEAHRQTPHFKAWYAVSGSWPRSERTLFEAVLIEG